MTCTGSHPIVFRRSIPALAAEADAAWTTPEIMRCWMAPGPNEVVSIEADIRIGGAFRLRSRAPDGATYTIDGEYRQLEPGRRIVMTWAYSGPVALINTMQTLIEVDFDEVAERITTMTFTQSQFTCAEAADAYAGDWPSCFTKLDGAVSAAANDKNKT